MNEHVKVFIQIAVAIWVIVLTYILWRIGYKWVTGHHSNPVPEEDPQISAAIAIGDEPVVDTGIPE